MQNNEMKIDDMKITVLANCLRWLETICTYETFSKAFEHTNESHGEGYMIDEFSNMKHDVTDFLFKWPLQAMTLMRDCYWYESTPQHCVCEHDCNC